MSTTAPVVDPYAAYGGTASTGADPYAAYGGKAVIPPASTDTRNSFQKSYDAAAAPVTDAQRAGHGVLMNTVQALGRGVLPLAQPFVHPVQTVENLPSTLSEAGLNFADPTGVVRTVATGKPSGPIKMASDAIDLAKQEKGYVVPDVVGQIGGGLVAGELGGEALNAARPIVGRAVTAVGDAAQDAGTGLMNKTVGTLKSDFKRGANPSRGYLATGNGPSISMQSLADKSADALEDVGSKLGTAYKSATDSGKLIPVDTVATEMAKPIQKAIDLETGPGGTGNLAAIKSYVDQFAPVFDRAAANGGFTPSDLFDMKRSIAQNTNWSDPAQFSLKSVRQQQAGALSGILSDAVPETTELNQQYQDLTKMSQRAAERANTGSRPLTAHIYKAGMAATGALAGGMEGNALAGAAAGALLDSVPVKTTIASGLYRGGKALSSLGERISPSTGAPMVEVPGNDVDPNGANAKPSNPQSQPPQLGNGSTSGPGKWASQGAAKVAQHIDADPSSGLTKADIARVGLTPKGQSLLINASDLIPGTPAMVSVVKQIQKLAGTQ